MATEHVSLEQRMYRDDEQKLVDNFYKLLSSYKSNLERAGWGFLNKKESEKQRSLIISLQEELEYFYENQLDHHLKFLEKRKLKCFTNEFPLIKSKMEMFVEKGVRDLLIDMYPEMKAVIKIKKPKLNKNIKSEEEQLIFYCNVLNLKPMSVQGVRFYLAPSGHIFSKQDVLDGVAEDVMEQYMANKEEIINPRSVQVQGKPRISGGIWEQIKQKPGPMTDEEMAKKKAATEAMYKWTMPLTYEESFWNQPFTVEASPIQEIKKESNENSTINREEVKEIPSPKIRSPREGRITGR